MLPWPPEEIPEGKASSIFSGLHPFSLCGRRANTVGDTAHNKLLKKRLEDSKKECVFAGGRGTTAARARAWGSPSWSTAGTYII